MERIGGEIWECRVGEQGKCCSRSSRPWCVQVRFCCSCPLLFLPKIARPFHPVMKPCCQLILVRTHLPGLASNLPCLRLDWHRCNPALPAQYYHLGARRLYPHQSRQHIPFASDREAIGSYFSRDCNLSLAHRRAKVL